MSYANAEVAFHEYVGIYDHGSQLVVGVMFIAASACTGWHLLPMHCVPFVEIHQWPQFRLQLQKLQGLPKKISSITHSSHLLDCSLALTVLYAIAATCIAQSDAFDFRVDFV